MTVGRGPLVLVVGPSGSGKDTLLHEARAAFAFDDGYYFPRRYITRPEEAGGEPHMPITRKEFEEGCANGHFSLRWQAHGQCYALPRRVLEVQARGVAVVANVSRTVIEQARREFAPVVVVLVTARREVLAERLAGRGRESAAEIENRLQRAGQYLPSGDDIYPIDNSGSLVNAVCAFTTLLRYARSGHLPQEISFAS